MKDRLSKYPGRVKLTPVSGQTHVYDMTRADQPTEAGDPLSKATFLKDATAALFGLGADAVPDKVFAILSKALLEGDTGSVDVLGNLAGIQMMTGSYVGAGTYGDVNPNTLTFGFTPKLVVIRANIGSALQTGVIFVAGQTKSAGPEYVDSSSHSFNITLTWGESAVSWYADGVDGSAKRQLNGSGLTYYYFAIGRGGTA